jgi:hypothetical protein
VQLIASQRISSRPGHGLDGPEVDLALARGGKLYGFLKVNYQWETYARVAPQGSELTIIATFLVKPIKLP